MRLLWRGQFGNHRGFSIVSSKLVEAISQLGIAIDIEPIGYGRNDILETRRSCEQIGQYDFVINCVNHYGINPQYGPRQIVLTACEAACASKEALKMDDCALEFWVPSNHSRQGLINAGITTTVFVLPHGVVSEGQAFQPRLPASDFRFLSVATWEWRKCPDLVIRAFLDEFCGEDGTKLIMKTRSVKSELEKPAGFSNKVVIVDEYISRSSLLDLYRFCHAYIGVTRGEGWGLPITEAIVFGLPVIATEWSAPTEYLDKNLNLFVTIDGYVRRPSTIDAEELTYVEPSYRSLRDNLRFMRENYPRQHSLMLVQRDKLIRDYAWSRVAESAVSRLRQLKLATTA